SVRRPTRGTACADAATAGPCDRARRTSAAAAWRFVRHSGESRNPVSLCARPASWIPANPWPEGRPYSFASLFWAAKRCGQQAVDERGPIQLAQVVERL